MKKIFNYKQIFKSINYFYYNFYLTSVSNRLDISLNTDVMFDRLVHKLNASKKNDLEKEDIINYFYKEKSINISNISMIDKQIDYLSNNTYYTSNYSTGNTNYNSDYTINPFNKNSTVHSVFYLYSDLKLVKKNKYSLKFLNSKLLTKTFLFCLFNELFNLKKENDNFINDNIINKLFESYQFNKDELISLKQELRNNLNQVFDNDDLEIYKALIFSFSVYKIINNNQIDYYNEENLLLTIDSIIDKKLLIIDNPSNQSQLEKKPTKRFKI